jgi:hypothetical protein
VKRVRKVGKFGFLMACLVVKAGGPFLSFNNLRFEPSSLPANLRETAERLGDGVSEAVEGVEIDLMRGVGPPAIGEVRQQEAVGEPLSEGGKQQGGPIGKRRTLRFD